MATTASRRWGRRGERTRSPAKSAKLLQEFPGFGVFSGSEEFLLANLRAGGVGCISASTNVTAALARPVYLAWQDKRADALQKALTDVRLVLQSYPMQATLKQVVAAISGNKAWVNLLPPNRPLSAAQASDVMPKLSAMPQVAGILGKAAPKAA